MEPLIFFNETELNGKFQVMANIELTAIGVKKYSVANNILAHKGEVFKGLINYWVTKKALINIKSQYNAERTCF